MTKPFAILSSLLSTYAAHATLPIIKSTDVLGTYEATVIVLSLPAEQVRELLPKGLELAPQTESAAGTHPVLLLLGKQKKVRNVVGRFEGPNFNYTETVVAIPYTQLAATEKPTSAYRGPFYFMPKIFLDNVVPMFLGVYYGYNKVLRKFVVNQDVYSFRDSQPIVEGNFKPVAVFGRPSAFAHYRSLARMMNQPIIGHRFDGFVCSLFNWDHAGDLSIQPVRGHVAILQTLYKSLTPRRITVESIADVPLGAFNIISNWRLQGPVSCSSIKASAPSAH